MSFSVKMSEFDDQRLFPSAFNVTEIIYHRRMFITICEQGVYLADVGSLMVINLTEIKSARNGGFGV